MRRSVALLLLLLVASCAGPTVRWRLDHDAALADARQENRPLLVFFRASWDVSSVEIEQIFIRPNVVDALNRLVTVRVDLTQANGAGEALLRSYDQVGVPSVVIVCPNGQRVTEIHEVIEPSEMVAALRAAKRTCRGRPTAAATSTPRTPPR